MRRVFIHCGLHKTGTTALQQFLVSAAPSLLQLGTLIPKAGRLDHFGGGHHNIAWHLTRDRRYDQSFGTLEQLITEIAAFDGDAVLSSEDFETCVGSPRLFAPLTEDIRLRGRKFIFVVYLRDQISYAEGLFTENLGHGIGDDCLAVVREILERRVLPAWEWRFQFDYLQLARRIRAAGPHDVVMRSYAALLGGSVVSDFVAVLSPGTVVDAAKLPRTNPRWQLLDALAMFYHNRINRQLTEPEICAIRLICAEAGGAPPILATGLRRAIARTFDPGNRTLALECGLKPDSLDLAARVAPAAGEYRYMDRVFSFETQLAIANLAKLLPETGLRPPPPLAALTPAAQDIIAAAATDWRTDDRDM